MRPRVLPEAEQEVLEAILWYEDRQEGLGEKFHEAARRAIEVIGQSPLRFPIYEPADLRRKLRRASVDRFPYYVVYEVRPDELLVVAVIHASRRPGYWTGR